MGMSRWRGLDSASANTMESNGETERSNKPFCMQDEEREGERERKDLGKLGESNKARY